MTNQKCLYCYEDIIDDSADYHIKCSRKFYGTDKPPHMEYSIDDLFVLAEKVIFSSIAMPGVQKKISLGVGKDKISGKNKLTIVGLWSDYILKPPSEDYIFLPENESLTMKLAESFSISTVPNCLIKLYSGELAYITKRIDHKKYKKLAMEDMAQLSGRLTHDKYKGSLEQIAKIIQKYSSNPGYDIIRFFEVNLFSFLIANSDMHLKNFSIIYDNGSYSLSPAYDLLSTRLVIPENIDKEEFALTMNGKKMNFTYNDFIKFAELIQINEKTISNIFDKFKKRIPNMNTIINNSFLNLDYKNKYKEILNSRADRLKLL